jgi:hypothetical protein
LEIDSKLEIGFGGKPTGFDVPSFSVYNHQSENRIVIFERETRVTARYIPPGVVYKDLEIERTDFLSYYLNDSGVREDTGPRRISSTAQSAAESHRMAINRNK